DQLAMTDDKLKTAEGRLKGVGDHLAAAGVKSPADPGKGVGQLAAERDAADKTLADVVAKLAGAGVKVDKAHVVEGVGHVVETAKITDPRGELVASKQEVKRLDAALAQRHTPQ